MPRSGRLEAKVFGIPAAFAVDADRSEFTLSSLIAPIPSTDGTFDVTLIVDRCSLEAFAFGGRVAVAAVDDGTLPDYSSPLLELTSTGDVAIDEIETISLKSIWE